MYILSNMNHSITTFAWKRLFSLKNERKMTQNDPKMTCTRPNLEFYISILSRYTKYMFVWILSLFALQLFKKFHFFETTKIFYFWNFPHFDGFCTDLKKHNVEQIWVFQDSSFDEETNSFGILKKVWKARNRELNHWPRF